MRVTYFGKRSEKIYSWKCEKTESRVQFNNWKKVGDQLILVNDQTFGCFPPSLVFKRLFNDSHILFVRWGNLKTDTSSFLESHVFPDILNTFLIWSDIWHHNLISFCALIEYNIWIYLVEVEPYLWTYLKLFCQLLSIHIFSTFFVMPMK